MENPNRKTKTWNTPNENNVNIVDSQVGAIYISLATAVAAVREIRSENILCSNGS